MQKSSNTVAPSLTHKFVYLIKSSKMTKGATIFSMIIICLTSCSSQPPEKEPILFASREAPVGYVVFKAYADSTFELTSGRGDKNHIGKYKVKADTIYLTTSNTLSFNKIAVEEKSIHFIGDNTPGYAGIISNKLTKK